MTLMWNWPRKGNRHADIHLPRGEGKAVPYLLPVIEPSPVYLLAFVHSRIKERSSHSYIRCEQRFFPVDWTFHKDPDKIGKANCFFPFWIWVGKGSGTGKMNNRTKQAIKPTSQKLQALGQDRRVKRLASYLIPSDLRCLSLISAFLLWLAGFSYRACFQSR